MAQVTISITARTGFRPPHGISTPPTSGPSPLLLRIGRGSRIALPGADDRYALSVVSCRQSVVRLASVGATLAPCALTGRINKFDRVSDVTLRRGDIIGLATPTLNGGTRWTLSLVANPSSDKDTLAP